MTSNLEIIPGLILGVIIILAVIAIAFAIKNQKLRKKLPPSQRNKYPEGSLTSRWMAVGIALGIPFGIAMDNVSLGIPIGLCLGLAIGAAKEAAAKRAGLIRPLTKAEKQQKKTLMWILLALVILGFLAFLAMFFAR